MSSKSAPSQIADQRRDARRTLESPIRMKFENETIQGLSDNLSSVGLMFFTNEPLRVQVEIEENGQTRTLTGSVVRIQRLGDTNTGIAVEFDPA